MPDFEAILEAARARVGGAEALDARLPVAKSAAELRAVPDDRYLSLMCLRIFRAGLRHGMVDAKWPAFEEVFHGFAPARVRAMNDEEIEALMGDARLIRHWGKIKSVRANAAALHQASGEAGGFGAWLGGWPGTRTVELWHDLAKRFSQLGGNSAPYFLRMAGRDTFLPTPDVARALDFWGVSDGAIKSKRGRARLQEAFDLWAGETGRPLCQLSMILALSTD